jgi:hypothetical protein
MTVCRAFPSHKFHTDHITVVIHTASGFHTASARALILGLGERKKETGNKVHYIHVLTPFHCITAVAHTFKDVRNLQHGGPAHHW